MSGGTRVAAFGTSHPDWMWLYELNDSPEYSTSSNSNSYGDWIRVRVDIDYSDGTVLYDFENLTSGNTHTTYRRDLLNNQEVDSINVVSASDKYELANRNNSSPYQEHYTDDISVNYIIDVPTAPRNVTATVNADDQITVDWDEPSDWGGERGNYLMRMSRDDSSWVAPNGGSETINDDGSVSYSESYGPSNDTGYNSVVGIDSKFQFYVRAENSAGNSNWGSTSEVYTTPIPPHDPSVNRPDADTIEISWENKSDTADIPAEVSMREDSGSGYGSWKKLDNFYGTSTTVSVGDSSSYNDLTISDDSRYQIKLRSFNTNASSTLSSEYVYADYGNQNKVYFEDDFEDGIDSSWGDSFSDNQSGLQSGSYADLGIDGADSGSNYVRIDNGENFYHQIGDLSSEENVIVRAVVATGSMDNSNEETHIQFYDGSTYHDLRTFSHEYNRQGWVQVTALVPSSYLGTDNYVRFKGHGGGGDHFAVDRVVVSDILHEYTRPTSPGALSLDTSVDREITASWSRDATFGEKTDFNYRKVGAGTTTQDGWHTGTQHTVNPLDDGEDYEIEIRALVPQFRNGNLDFRAVSSYTSSTAITNLPAPTNFSIDGVDGAKYLISWTGNSNYGNIEVAISATGGSSFVTDGSTSHTNTTYTTDSYPTNNEHVLKVRATTEHTESGYTSTDSEILAGIICTSETGVLDSDLSGEVRTE